jgi:hypothetical protein
LHLVSSTEAVLAASLKFTFTDGHAEMDISQFYTDLDDLNKLDWQIMGEKFWNDTLKDGDRKRRRQAEFLVHRFFPLPLIESIGVINRTIAQQVAGLLQPLAQKPTVQVLPAWYY